MMGDQTKHLRLFWAPGTLGEATHDPQALVGLDQLLGLQTLVKGPEGYQEGVIILVTDSHVDHHTHFRLSPEALGRARRTPGLTTMPRAGRRERGRASGPLGACRGIAVNDPPSVMASHFWHMIIIQ